jgi:acetyl esterase/lipase
MLGVRGVAKCSLSPAPAPTTTAGVKQILLWMLTLGAVASVALVAAYAFTPWPRALRVRYVYDRDSRAVAERLEPLVPPGITAILDQPYDPGNSDVRLDVFHPADDARARTTVVWVHGGGWLSGSKDFVANYLKILASKGFTVVGVSYSLAPGATYPTPVGQVNTALGWLVKNAARLQIDPSRIVLAGDSAGPQIALQVATMILQPSYAQLMGLQPTLRKDQLAGLLFYCGLYWMDPEDAENDFSQAEFWSYSGTRNFLTDKRFATAWVMDRLNGDFPPAFVSVGSEDGLRPQSIAFADKLEKSGVRVERVIFPTDLKPPLYHEFQFDLRRPEARLALEKSVEFLSSLHK